MNTENPTEHDMIEWEEYEEAKLYQHILVIASPFMERQVMNAAQLAGTQGSSRKLHDPKSGAGSLRVGTAPHDNQGGVK